MAKKPVPRKPAAIASGKKKKVESAVQEPSNWIPCPVVGIGASAGGLEAFSRLLAGLPGDTGLAFVLVQHLDPAHESSLAEILGGRTTMSVVQVHEATLVFPNHVYVIPPNTIMRISGGRLELEARGARNERHMPVDAFLTSLAADQKSNAFGVILSGTASDGTLGLKAIKDEGGITFAQDERSALFPGMPRNAVAMGAVDFILPPEKIAKELASIARHAAPSVALGNLPDGPARIDEGPEFQAVLNALRVYAGVDFTHYKHATTKRRIARRMTMHRVDKLGDYLKLLNERPPEMAALFEDLLINVTEFFRDSEVFEFLRDHSITEMLKSRSSDQPLRVWVPACSTGEEAYSLAILVKEVMDNLRVSCPLQVFGTDVSDSVIEKARTGIYPASAVTGLSPERLRNYFIKLENGFQIRPGIRECCVFSRHNVTKDPPLSRMDLISCRNLLIYLGPVLQKRVITMFHYALQPGGCLVLGSSESLGVFADYFVCAENRHKIYCRKPGRSMKTELLDQSSVWQRSSEVEVLGALNPPGDIDNLVAQREADRVLLARYAPSGFLVDGNLRIIEFRGRIGQYLGPSPGEASFHLLKMLRDELIMPVRAAIDEARGSDLLARKEKVRYRTNGDQHTVNLTVLPIAATVANRLFLVLFEDPDESIQMRPQPRLPRGGDRKASEVSPAAIAQLEEDLASTRQYLQSIIEELRSANEEIQSSNEELQSTNEELQTAKEELQSSNEELTTINEEMGSRNSELTQVNNDLVNLLTSISMPIVMLGGDLRIRRFTPLAARIFNFIPTDIGRPILDIKPDFEIPDLEDMLLGVIRTPAEHEREVVDRAGRWHLLRVRPYRTTDNKIDGVVIQMLDIDALKRSLDEARAAREYAEAIVDTVREPLVVLDADLRVQRANRSFYQIFRVAPQETEGQPFYSLGNRQWDLAKVHGLLDKMLHSGDELRDVEVEQEFDRLGRRTMLLTGRSLQQEQAPGLILLAIQDVTEQKLEAEARYRRLFEAAQDGIIIVSVDSEEITDVNPYLLNLFGYARQDLVGRRFFDLDLFRSSEEVRNLLRDINEQRVVRMSDLSLPARDGHTVLVEVVANAYAESERRVIQFNVRDVSDRRRLEQQLRQTAKLESIGLLAGGIAHDFNNLLTGILGNASLAVNDVAASSGTRRLLDEVVRAAERAADLTRQLLAYAGKGRFVVTSVDFSALIRDTTPLIQTSIPRNVRLDMKLAENLAPVSADPGQMQQIVMNLIINAAESIRESGSGVVTVKTSVVQADEPFLSVNFGGADLKAGQYVCVQVSDNGIGMDEGTRARIFDPFFTTKFTGRGLGLAAVHGIVRGHKGGIRVQSTPGLGSVFEVILPVTQPKPSRAQVARTRRNLNGSGTVLIVDDEDVVLQMAQETLERYGYKVLTANNGQKGVELFRQRHADLSLVLLDMMMPVMSGPDALKEMRSISADVPVVLSSGYNEADTVKQLSRRGFAGFIQKPYTPMQLAEKINTVLSSGAARARG